jgi:hypothetical protein
MQERTVGGVPPALDGLRGINLDGGINEAVAVYSSREETWVDLADEGFGRLVAVEAECADLRERVAWLEARMACAGGFIATTLVHCTSLLSQAERAIREGGGR